MRLDLALVARGLARSRNQAARLIANGRVRVGGRVVTKAALQLTDEFLEVDREPYVSRAAYKLLGAIRESGTPIGGRVLDAGASTGGFTQVVLEYGAERVYAVDVGHGQLAAELRGDRRVTVREGLNLRNITPDDLDGSPVDLIVGDVSFISLTLIVGQLRQVIVEGGAALLLVKPQFEVGRDGLGPGGIVTDPSRRRAAVETVQRTAEQLGWSCDWSGTSVLPGSDGNEESFIRLIADQPRTSGGYAATSSRVDP